MKKERQIYHELDHCTDLSTIFCCVLGAFDLDTKNGKDIENENVAKKSLIPHFFFENIALIPGINT